VCEVVENVSLVLKVLTGCLHGCEFGCELGFAGHQTREFALDASALGDRCRLHPSRWGPGLGGRHLLIYSGLGHCG
jgi:hypothetical protein